MGVGSAENDNANCELNDQNITDSAEAEDSDNFYNKINKQTHSDFVKLKEMEEGCFKMTKEISLLQLDVASSFNPQIKRAESRFEANIVEASGTIQEIERLMSSELEELSKLFSEC